MLHTVYHIYCTLYTAYTNVYILRIIDTQKNYTAQTCTYEYDTRVTACSHCLETIHQLN